MAKMLRKTLIYGLLLATGVTLGMQLAESGTSSILGSGFQTAGTTAGMNGQSTSSPYSQSQQQIQQQQQTQQQLQQQLQQLQQQLQQYHNSWTASSNTTENGQALQTPADLLMPPPSPPAIDRFADKAAHLLQQASQKSIHWVASWFGPGE